MTENRKPLSFEELDAEGGSQLPDKEVLSLLDLFVNIDLALDLAAPIDLAVAAQANAALPIDGSVSANVLSFNSDAVASTTQQTSILQTIDGNATATAPQDASIDQSNDIVDGGTTGTGDTLAAEQQVVGVDTEPVGDTVGGVTDTVDGVTDGTLDGVTDTVGDTVGDTGTGLVSDVTESTGGLLSDGLLKLNVDVALDADMAAPIAGAVAANANVAAPVDAAVSANILSFDSTATAVANQTAIIEQSITGDTTATADQTADIVQ